MKRDLEPPAIVRGENESVQRAKTLHEAMKGAGKNHVEKASEDAAAS